ncbi:MAG TPA: VTT domain-containing protein [Propionibacteriaceae bacterium]|nr:VTT domain-containing protein [Propionibacteriaceae bacterium]
MDFVDGLPFPLAVTVLFVIVFLRANATYWAGRAAHAGAGRTRARRLLHSDAFATAQRLVDRWGAPVISFSFLTIGFQTVVNLAAGVTRMPLRHYLPAVTVGCTLWAFIYATVGFVTLEALRRLYLISPAAAIAAIVLLVAALASFVVVQLRASRAPSR